MPILKNSIAVRLGFGLGLILSLFVIAVAVSFWESNEANAHIGKIVEVNRPKTLIAYDMSANSAITSLGLARYMQTGDIEARQIVTEGQETFKALESKYQELANAPIESELVQEVHVFYGEYLDLATTMMNLADKQDALLSILGENFQILDRTIEEQKTAISQQYSLDADDVNSAQKLIKLSALDDEMTNLAKTGTNFLLSPRKDRQNLLLSFATLDPSPVQSAMLEYLSLDLTAPERASIEEATFLVRDSIAYRQQIIDSGEAIEASLESFVGLSRELDNLLNDQIQTLNTQDLIESKLALKDIGSETSTFMLTLLLVGLVVGIASAVLLTRSITRPIGKLVTATRRVHQGDLSARANLSTTDELGLLSSAFDEMMTGRQRSEEALVASEKEQRQLANENAANATLGRIISSSLDIESVYDKFAEQVHALLPFDRLSVLSFDEDSDSVGYNYVSGLDIPLRKPGTFQSLTGSLYHEMVKDRRPRIFNFNESDDFPEGYRATELLQKSGLHSLMGAPLIHRGELIGVLNFSSKQKNAYDEESQSTAQRVADQIAGAISNASIYLELQNTEMQLLISQDLLEARVLERTAELEAARDLALKATQTKSRFLANMSHELRTPLNAVIGYGELLAILTEKNGHNEYTTDLEKIAASAAHLLVLVDEILDLSRIESGKMEFSVEEFEISRVVTASIDLSRPLIRENRNDLNVNCDPSIGLIKTDENRLRQALCNLLSNAGKFTEDGTISVTVSRGRSKDNQEEIYFEVSDTGIGMTEEVLGRLFQPFTQADSSTVVRYGGTGLGLALSREFCHLMGGEITVTSELGSGSKFLITLPATLDAPLSQVLELPKLPELPEPPGPPGLPTESLV